MGKATQSVTHTDQKWTWAAAVLCTWVAIVVIAFWWYQWRWYFAVELSDAWFSSEQLMDAQALDATIGAPLVVHYFDPACPCSKFNTPHVLELMGEYKAQGVQFLVRVPRSEDTATAQNIFVGTEVEVAKRGLEPNASPAALVINSFGSASYVGPYSAGLVCGPGDEDFVSQALTAALMGEPIEWQTNLAKGCFCPWPTTVEG